MPTPEELLRVLLVPIVVSAIIALIAFWRRWTWLAPIAIGAGFISGYALLGVPKLPPADGSDWLFWLVMPLTGLAAAATLLPARWRWPFGVLAGVVAYMIIKPLVPTAVSSNEALAFAGGAAGAGLLYGLAATLGERRVSPLVVGLAFSFALGAAAVVVMSSNVRIVGLYGVAAAASVGPMAIFCGPLWPGQVRYQSLVTPSLAIMAGGLMAGIFASGRFYADPGVTWTNLSVIAAAPLLLLVGAYLPIKRVSIRAAVALILVIAALAAVTVPTAIAAKHAAEDDPYGSNG